MLFFFPMGLIFIIFIKNREKKLYKIAVALDQLGNVVCSRLLNITLLKKNGYKFGYEDETISSVIGKNQLKNTLTNTGKIVNKILSDFQPNHAIKAIENF